MRALLAAALLLAMPLAGCMSGDEPTLQASATTGEIKTLDALAGFATAQQAAQAWRPDATLRAIASTEGHPTPLQDPPYQYDTMADPVVGDGLALQWTYVFMDGQGAAYAVVVDGAGEARYRHELSAPSMTPAGEPLGAGWIGSAAAFAPFSANGTVAAFNEEHPVSEVDAVLTRNPDGPQWIVTRHTASGFSVVGIVDARTAKLVQIHRFPMDFIVDPLPPCACYPPGPPGPEPRAPPPDEEMARTATLDAFNTQARFDMPVTHPEFTYAAHLQVDVPGVSPAQDRTVRVFDESGFPIATKTGTGIMAFDIDGANVTMPGGMIRVVIESGGPAVPSQEVTFKGLVHYVAWRDWGAGGPVSMGSSSVGFGQVNDQPIVVDPNVVRVTTRIVFDPSSAALPDAQPTTWEILAPDGKAVASGSAPGGSAELTNLQAGTYTLRVTGGSAALFGQSYHYAAIASWR